MAKGIHIAEDLLPIGRFKGEASAWLQRLVKTERRIVITRNGRAAGVLLAPADYDDMQYRQGLLEDVAAGLADVQAGRTFTSAEVRRELKRRRSRSR